MSATRANTEKLTLSFPRELAKKVRNHVKKGNISKYVAEATRLRIEAEEKEKLRKELVEAYAARADLHRELAAEFYEAEEEAYQRSGFAENQTED